MSCSLNIKNLSYEDLFCNISFDLGHCEKIAIVGENGCGKTTLLEILAGLKTASKYDNFEIFHNHINSKNDFKKLRHKLGYLFQDSNDQFIAPNVLEDVAFGLLAAGMSWNEAQIKSLQMLDKLGISKLADKSPFALSGGEKKLVALSGILVCEPDLIFLDEPTNNLNQLSQKKLAEVLNDIQKSMIIVSHHNDFLNLVVDKTYFLDENGLTLDYK